LLWFRRLREFESPVCRTISDRRIRTVETVKNDTNNTPPHDNESQQPMTLPTTTTQNKSALLTKLLPIAFVVTAALWLVVIVITDLPAWPLPVYVALGIPAIQRLSRSDKYNQPN
jgi:hypothetical protein